LAHNYQLPSLLQLRTIGETLTDEQRQLFHKAWGVKTVDCYTCEESGYIALQCPEHEHYHVQSENVIVEIVDDNGKPCAVGEPGRVLITSLQNFATPLIRYELGDLAEWGEPCDCGRTLPVIKKIHGRKRSRLTLPDGRSEFPYLGEHGEILALIGRSPDEIQYVQTTVNDVLVRLKISPALNKDEEALIAAKVVENFGYAFNISFEHHDKPLPRNRRGKFEYFVNQVNS
jgi:phenylacetate-CoA ligase